MKKFDCTLYYDEDLILDLRLNILNKYFDKFIICEAKYTHSGREKKLNFDIKKFYQFKNKIEYIVQDSEPNNLILNDKNNKSSEEPKNYRINSVRRIAHQRNKILEVVQSTDNNDYIFYSDNDEIPDMNQIDLTKESSKILIFQQKLFYYKFNLLCDRIFWYGTRAVQKKNLLNFEWLRQIKPKQYPFYRVDTIFKKDKYINLKIIENGGWHFTRVLSPEEIHRKELDAEHHDEYRASNKNAEKIKDLIRRKVIDHDHLADSKTNKYGKEFPLKNYELHKLPKYLVNNKEKYKNYLDNN